MTNKHNFSIRYSLALIISTVALFCPTVAKSLPSETYATNSVLSEGKWAKISVEKSGIYLLSKSKMRSMGFSDPSKVHIYGYGAMRLPEVLNNTYIDDLPMVQTLETNEGLLFYAQGPENWKTATYSGAYTPSNNPFTLKGYYYVSDRPIEKRQLPEEQNVGNGDPVDVFTAQALHEVDLVALSTTGHTLAGEDFLTKRSQTFTIDVPNRVEETDIVLECSFLTKSSGITRLTFKVNGVDIPASSSDFVGATSESHSKYREGRIWKTFEVPGDKLDITLSINSSESLAAANLNYLSVNYQRKLKLGNEPLAFYLAANSAKLSGANAKTQIWDITDPLDIHSIKGSLNGSDLTWGSLFAGTRRYIAFDAGGRFPEPEFVGSVRNQNLHALEVPEMVIFTPSHWRDEAQRLADFHANYGDSLKVAVVVQDDVFNEFSSGSPDVNSFRKMLKMFYDRSTEETKLQYAIFMGRGTYDARAITPVIKSITYPRMPIWQTEFGGTDTDSYTTDDVFGFLNDNSGLNFSTDKLCIAVGRMPVTSSTEAREAVNKVIEYCTKQPRTGWRQQVLLIADDDDGGVHMEQTDRLYSTMINSDGGQDISYQKLYTDEYDLVGGTYEKGREALNKALDEGVVWWFYHGHANMTSITAENLLTYSDINSLYLRHYPIVLAATCDFLRWDNTSISAAEIMWGLKNGGAIAIISANRPVYISDNGNLTKSFGNYVFKRDENGKRMTLGKIYMKAKNDVSPDANKLRYVLMGDPAIYPLIPDNKIVIEKIDGIDVDSDEDIVLKARQSTSIQGYVADVDGKIIEDFNGDILSTLYDAEYSVTTKGNGKNGKKFSFDKQGARIFAGSDSVINGRFNVQLAMPSEIANNYRPAAIKLYATTAEPTNARQAGGMNRGFYVFGEDDSATDDEPPTIEAIYLNHPTFRNGDRVNSSPMLIAKISDNRGINISTAGIGHQMSIMLDEKRNYANVADYYTPSSEDVAAGTIAYPLEGLAKGPHTLKLRIWDTSNNSASAFIDFYVDEDLKPHIYDIYSDANPASTQANFYLSHDRPDAMVEVTVSVYNLLGREVWSTKTAGRSDMFLSTPVTWDLTDVRGSRVGRGIYLYRASIIADGVESSTKTRRIAVTGI